MIKSSKFANVSLAIVATFCSDVSLMSAEVEPAKKTVKVQKPAGTVCEDGICRLGVSAKPNVKAKTNSVITNPVYHEKNSLVTLKGGGHTNVINADGNVVGEIPAVLKPSKSIATSQTKTQPQMPPMPRPSSIVWQADLTSAVNMAKREKKHLLINVGASWCHYCVKMKKETYTDKSLINLLNQQFVAVQITPDTHREFITKLGIKSLPSAVFFSPEMKLVKTIKGFKTPGQFTAQLKPMLATKSNTGLADQIRAERIDHSVVTTEIRSGVVSR